MSKLKITYIITLLILGILVVFTIFRPMASEDTFTEVTKESIIQLEDEWVIQMDIINREGKTSNYIINWSSGEQTITDRLVIKDKYTFTYIYHVLPEAVVDGQVRLEIYKEGEATPFEQVTYYVSFD
ncbi:hypothetical protein ACFLUE_02140 [Chloroflexota bacterium]